MLEVSTPAAPRPADEAFADGHFAVLTAERREVRKRAGQPYAACVLPSGKRNEALVTSSVLPSACLTHSRLGRGWGVATAVFAPLPRCRQRHCAGLAAA